MVKADVDDIVCYGLASNINRQSFHLAKRELIRFGLKQLLSHQKIPVVACPVQRCQLCVRGAVVYFSSAAQQTLHNNDAMLVGVFTAAFCEVATEAHGHKWRKSVLVLLVN